jgi:Carboxypeptidase regulatory-like domain
MFKHLISRAAVLCSIILCSVGLMAGQVRTTGQLSIVVLDSSGGGIPGAELTISQPSTGFTQVGTSNSVGECLFPVLQPGTYQLRVSAKGFSTAAYSDVVIDAAKTSDLRVQLKVGEATETVRVSTEGEALETTTNTLSSTISPEGIENLPLGGRDVLPFAQLVPGAQVGGDLRFTTYNALPNGAINITVDGVNNNFQRYRTSTTGFYTGAPLREGAFDEVTVSTDSLTADAGAEGSVQLRFVTKRGTNTFHGDAFWQAQNSYFNANSYTNNALGLKKSPFHLNDYGGSLGGPLWKNKVFFFFHYEEEDNPFSATSSLLIPTLQAQQGIFTYDGTDGAQHTVNLLQLAASQSFPSTVNSTIGNILGQINSFSKNQSLTPVSGLPYMTQFSFFQRQSNTNRYPTARLDYQLSDKLALHGSWDLYWRNIANTQPYPGDTAVSNGFKSTYYTGMLGFDWTVTPRLVNQFNFGVLSTVEEFNPGNNFQEFQSQGNRQIAAPQLAGGQGALFAPIIPSFIFPLPRNNPVWNLYDNVSWTRGKHTFTFGGDYRLSTMHELESNSPPTYSVGLNNLDPALSMFSPSNFPAINQATDLQNAAALYGTLVGRLTQIFGFNEVDSKTRQYQVAGALNYLEKQIVGGLYIQDGFRVTPHLSLNYGFRWQLTGPIHNTNNFNANPTYADLLGPSTQLFQPGQLNGDLNPVITLRPSPYSADLRQPAPNFGFAWNPIWQNGILGKLAGGGNFVLRGGYRISRYDEGWTTFEQATFFGNPGPTQTAFLFPGSGQGQFAPGSLNLDSTVPPNTFPSSFTFPLQESAFTFAGQPFGTVDPRIRAPYVESWNFGIQRKLPGATVLEINYVGNHSIHMWTNTDLNEVNIFENGFLSEFKNAQNNLQACLANSGCSANPSFQNQGLPGQVALPIFDAAFGGTGAALPSNALVTSSYTNTQFIPLLQQGQAGALAYQLASTATYLCNMVGGTSFSPCSGYAAGKYPINFFQANPYAAGLPIVLLSDPGSESYNGLQLQVKHPVGRGLMLNANYTYSHAFTNRYIGDYFTADQAVMNFTTLRDRGINRVPSPYDFRHVFRVYGTYDLPFGDGRQFKTNSSILNRVIGGWTAGTILTAQSGRNFKLLGGFNSFNYYSTFLNAPDLSDSGVVLNGITRGQLQSNVGVFPGPTPGEPVVFLNPNLFANGNQPILPVTTPGQLGQFIFLTGPMFINTDISLLKSIPIREKVRFNIYAEFVNAFNHPNWNVTDNFSFSTNNPAQYVNLQNSTFTGASIANPNNGAGGARNIQFRLQLAF